MRFGNLNIDFGDSILNMGFNDFLTYWERSGLKKRSGLTPKQAAKKLRIKVPTEK
jgi:hypothetical protein